MVTSFRNGGVLEFARPALIFAVLFSGCRHRDQTDAVVIPGEPGPRVEVEVLNASGKPGLAKAATRTLRRGGIDVVDFGNAAAAVGTLDSTQILVRRGPASAGERVRRVLAVGRVVMQPDTSRLLDVSVLLGADFTPRLEFHP